MGKEAKIGHARQESQVQDIRSLMLAKQERKKGDENLQYSER